MLPVTTGWCGKWTHTVSLKTPYHVSDTTPDFCASFLRSSRQHSSSLSGHHSTPLTTSRVSHMTNLLHCDKMPERVILERGELYLGAQFQSFSLLSCDGHMANDLLLQRDPISLTPCHLSSNWGPLGDIPAFKEYL